MQEKKTYQEKLFNSFQWSERIPPQQILHKLRNLLFLAAFSACKYNKACKALYDRIVDKKKSKKLALIAVANKLLKQAFAIAKSGLPYEENFVSKLN